MKEIYKIWIENWLSRNNPVGKCAEATMEMKKAFPELTRVGGDFFCPKWLQSSHWWLIAPDGSIVDPTIGQFIYTNDSQYKRTI
jgi:hypothetical protein